MKIAMFYHSLVSDWNNGNAHFLRGMVSELIAEGHQVQVFEPRDGWSLKNLLLTVGPYALNDFRQNYPELESTFYDAETLDLDSCLQDADLVIVHEWNSPELVCRIGLHRRKTHGYKLLFHDTHHKSITQAQTIESYQLCNYDGVLAFGNVIRDIYLKKGWARHAWTLHEAADVRVFRPVRSSCHEGEVVWIGNWGDDERSAEIMEYLVTPVRELKSKSSIYGVRYPAHVVKLLRNGDIDYRGWVANFKVPDVFGRHKLTLHIPRKPYAEMLPGIPTIRPFEAMACGIPLISAPWQDCEGLFTAGKDYLAAENGSQMQQMMRTILNEPEFAEGLAAHGRETILKRHTCRHRMMELLRICNEIGIKTAEPGLVVS